MTAKMPYRFALESALGARGWILDTMLATIFQLVRSDKKDVLLSKLSTKANKDEIFSWIAGRQPVELDYGVDAANQGLNLQLLRCLSFRNDLAAILAEVRSLQAPTTDEARALDFEMCVHEVQESVDFICQHVDTFLLQAVRLQQCYSEQMITSRMRVLYAHVRNGDPSDAALAVLLWSMLGEGAGGVVDSTNEAELRGRLAALEADFIAGKMFTASQLQTSRPHGLEKVSCLSFVSVGNLARRILREFDSPTKSEKK